MGMVRNLTFALGLSLLATSGCLAGVVADRAGLLAALAAAKAGDVITLAGGFYGVVSIEARFSADVTITSARPLAARFAALTLSNSSHLRLDGLHVDAPGNGNWGQALLAIEASDHIAVLNCEINGKVDGLRPIAGYFGIRARNSTAITVQNTFAHDVLNGMAFFGVDDLNLAANTVDGVGADSFKFGGVNNALIEDNTGAKRTYSAPDAHEDFMQFQGAASSNVTIRGNVFLPQNVFDVQGIFVAGKGGHSNFLIEQNILHSSMANGIYVAKGSTGVRIRDNTLIAADGAVTRISAPAGAEISGNITSGRRGVLEGGNLTMQGSDAEGTFFIGALFPGWVLGGAMALADLQPAPGSAAASTGAVSRLRELLP